ncbi:hypothetical protein HYN59_15005 [Flavobacterium album]|uniref:Uncharacterized protein n=1 Tax=Flavobacterium album TaxID=2175091 RepID=A0A2S1R117_9FLAO|nr:hypothetical protein [Flavobacterium album]AWH86335.1 hypothetical protein HYN59_15005 [Flavobacterium album]
MNDFSIEHAGQKIVSAKTKDYFKEVASSYFNNNHRAAVVTLYSVVISDMIDKLETLADIYSDAIAISILDNIRKFQADHPTSPEWEKTLVEEIKTRTSLIDNVDYARILSLRNDRHLCAHPVIDKEDRLHTPNKETVGAHIRNMLESFFLKPPILSKKILGAMLQDLADKKDILINQLSINKYVGAKYLENLTPSIEVIIFRDLWKIVFKLDDSNAKSNRKLNYKLLKILYERNLSAAIEKIKSEKKYFSNVHDSDTVKELLINFIAENEDLYSVFSEDVRLLLAQEAEKDPSAKTSAWFLSPNFLDHLATIKGKIDTQFDATFPYDASADAYNILIRIGVSKGYTKEITEFIIWRYITCRSYNEADKIFTYVLKPNLDRLDDDQFEGLCESVNGNSQCWSRNRAEDDHTYLKNYITTKLGSNFPFSNFRNVFN